MKPFDIYFMMFYKLAAVIKNTQAIIFNIILWAIIKYPRIKRKEWPAHLSKRKRN